MHFLGARPALCEQCDIYEHLRRSLSRLAFHLGKIGHEGEKDKDAGKVDEDLNEPGPEVAFHGRRAEHGPEEADPGRLAPPRVPVGHNLGQLLANVRVVVVPIPPERPQPFLLG